MIDDRIHSVQSLKKFSVYGRIGCKAIPEKCDRPQQYCLRRKRNRRRLLEALCYLVSREVYDLCSVIDPRLRKQRRKRGGSSFIQGLVKRMVIHEISGCTEDSPAVHRSCRFVWRKCDLCGLVASIGKCV